MAAAIETARRLWVAQTVMRLAGCWQEARLLSRKYQAVWERRLQAQAAGKVVGR